MLDKCPYAIHLSCSQQERKDEFYRQMSESFLSGTQVIFVTGGQCPAYQFNCLKLREFLERNKTK